MQRSEPQDSRTIGAGLIGLGALLAATAAVCAGAAADHMAMAAGLCGPAAQHCILCVIPAASLLASAGVAAAGAMLMLLGERPQASKAGPRGV